MSVACVHTNTRFCFFFKNRESVLPEWLTRVAIRFSIRAPTWVSCVAHFTACASRCPAVFQRNGGGGTQGWHQPSWRLCGSDAPQNLRAHPLPQTPARCRNPGTTWDWRIAGTDPQLSLNCHFHRRRGRHTLTSSRHLLLLPLRH